MKEESIILSAVADVVRGEDVQMIPVPAWEQLTLLLVIVREKCDSARGGKALRSDAIMPKNRKLPH